MKIEIIEGADQGEILKLGDHREYIIGRDRKCDICISDSKSSRRHARIFPEENRMMVEDLNSTNGVFLNGKTIFKEALNENDEILIGDTVLLVTDLGESDSSSSSSLHIHDAGSSTVIVSTMPHNEADLLSGKPSTREIDELVQENSILRKVCEISQIVATNRENQDLFKVILDTLQQTLSSDTACILIWSEQEQDWIIRAMSSSMEPQESVRVSRTIIKQALDEGVAILSTNPLTDGRFDPSMSIIAEGVSSAICSPLKIENRYLGVLFFDRRNREEFFTTLELRLAASVANILGLFMEKEKLEQEARRKQRLAVIGEVIAGLAHYTKNIITGLRFSINALEIIIQKKQYGSIEKCLRSISLQERRISELVLNMLSYSKDRVPSPARVDVRSVLEDVVEPYRSHIEENGITVAVHAPERPVILLAEESAMHRTFLNLLMNAVDSFKNKKIERDKRIDIHVEPDSAGKSVDIRFRDNGCGISTEKLKKIFTVFYSTKGSEGTGLGLAVVHKIVNEHGGAVTVDSVLNEWTEFKITMPLSDS
jgi:signal transduction histidine kinase/pSer/pThr/pTyr-binding forkhead associated (FHA) protein